jgi:transposase
MQNNDSLQDKNDQPTFSLIQRIKDGEISADILTKEERRNCVDTLLREGMAAPAMAQFFKRSKKTIKRDIEWVIGRNADTLDADARKNLASETIMYGRIHRDHLMKLARSKDASVSERAQAELFAAKVFIDAITKLQALGFLPTAPQGIVGDIYHHVDGIGQDASFSELRKMVEDVINTAKETDAFTPELQEEAKSLTLKIEKAEMAFEIGVLKQIKPKKEEEND